MSGRDMETASQMRLAILCIAACTRIIHPQPSAVSITYRPVMPSCSLDDVPKAPPMLEFNFDDDDIIQRTTVHIGQYNLLQQWAADMEQWAGAVKGCINSMGAQ